MMAEKRNRKLKCPYCDGNHVLESCWDYDVIERLYALEKRVKKLEQGEARVIK